MIPSDETLVEWSWTFKGHPEIEALIGAVKLLKMSVEDLRAKMADLKGQLDRRPVPKY